MKQLVLLAKVVFLSLAASATIYLLFWNSLSCLTQPNLLVGPPRHLVPHKINRQIKPVLYNEQYLRNINHGTTTVHNQAEIQAASKFWQANIPILMYHYIEDVSSSTRMAALYLSPAIFEEQLQAIKLNHYNPIFASEAAKSLRDKKPLPARSLALTFDDGYEDFYDNVYPLLKKYDIKATLYVIINRIDQPGYVSETELKELSLSRFVEIGSHTFNHPDLKLGNTREADWEIKESKKGLERITGRPVLTFAYPFGRYNYEDVEIASSTGYLGAVTVDPGSSQSDNSLYLLKRLRPDDRPGPLFAKWLNRVFAIKE